MKYDVFRQNAIFLWDGVFIISALHKQHYLDANFKRSSQSKGSKVNPINNALISNLMTDLESLYNFLSEYMF